MSFLARNTDPSTSHAAAARVTFADQHHTIIYNCLLDHGPKGKDGIARITRLEKVQVSRRMIEMKRKGIIVLTGQIVMSDSQRGEREWIAVIPTKKGEANA